MASNDVQYIDVIAERLYSAIQEDDHLKIVDLFKGIPQTNDILHELLPLKGKVCNRDNYKYEFLFLICEKGNVDILLHFLAMDADVDFTTHRGTPLCVACEYGHFEIVRRLLQHGADCTKASPEAGTPLYIATQNGHEDIVDFLVTSNPELVENQVDKDTMLHAACLGKSIDLTEYWIDAGADINGEVYVYQDIKGDHPQTPLQAACESQCFDIATYLIEKGAELRADVVQTHGQFLTDILHDDTRLYISPNSNDTTDDVYGSNEELQIAKWSEMKLNAISLHWFEGITNTLVELSLFNNSLYLTSLPDIIPWKLPVLEVLIVSKNSLQSLPSPVGDIQCNRLKEYRASNNNLESVPIEIFQLPSLEKLMLDNNQMTSLECVVEDRTHDVDDVDSPRRESVHEDSEWNCPELSHLDVSHNNLKRLPKGIQSASKLRKLLVGSNKLVTLPQIWSCPLEVLDASNNKIAALPNDIRVYWSKSLRTLDLSNNKLEEIPWGVCQLTQLHDLILVGNRIERFPKTDYWHTAIKLRKLDLSLNKLSNAFPSDMECSPDSPPDKAIATPSPRKGKHRFSFPDFLRTSPRTTTTFHFSLADTGSEDLPVIEFPAQFFHSLECLKLQGNKLRSVPATICNMGCLTQLDIRNNPDITCLPLELGNLHRCWNFEFRGLKIDNLPANLQPEVASVRAAEVFACLKAQKRRSEPYYRMKLMVVGVQNQGKTTLLAALQGQPLPKNVVTNGIVINKWILSDQSKTGSLGFLKNKNIGPDVIFSTWDLAGQPEYNVTHQCFLTSNTLYLAVWKVSDGEEGLAELEPWLANIQARAPDSHVILVATHIDTIPPTERKALLDKVNLKIMTQFVKKKGKGFPHIVDVHYVSCTTGEGIIELRKGIYERACKVPYHSSMIYRNTPISERVIGRKVPRSYLLLQDEVEKEAKYLASLDPPEPPVLTEDAFESLASRVPDCDIDTAEDLQLVANFLNETGQILHYNDQMRGLNTLYFIDPIWLCHFLARVITVRAVHHYVDAGKMSVSNMKWLFHDEKYPKELLPQYLQLLERFEIALALSSRVLLIPSMLPKAKPGFSPESLPSLNRTYKMSYVPSGFWSRLITRLIVNVERLVSGSSTKPARSAPSVPSMNPSGARRGLSRGNSWNDSRRYSSRRGFRLHDKKMIYWREGIVVSHSRGYFSVESGLKPVKREGQLEYQQGINITVASSSGDFSALGFIVDQIDSLITEWFPGLEDRDHEGQLIVHRLITCPVCMEDMLTPQTPEVSGISTGSDMFNLDPPQLEPCVFTVEKCAVVAVTSDEIICDAHPDRPVPLSTLVPDLLLCDLPKKFMLDGTDLEFSATRQSCLGTGGAATVFRGSFKGQDIAVKQFHATRGNTFNQIFVDDSDSGVSTSSSADTSGSSGSCQGLGLTVTDTSMKEELGGIAAIKAFKELRGEVSLLCKLNHPCIVKLVGISLQPMCFALELAPMGSLQNILQEASMSRQQDLVRGSVYGTLLDQVLTFKIALQVAKALVYLHQQDVVYCDLKSDNVLVWSLDVDAPVNAKISDYGISRISSPQGVQGSDGTPGFQAPEVRPGITYNEKADIFSYSMLLFELTSGLRPYDQVVRTIEITKAVRNGRRPAFKEHGIEMNCPELENLMKDCWHNSPIKRPSAKTIVKRMKNASFLCQKRVIIVYDVKCMLYTPPYMEGGSSYNVWFWCGETENRRFSMMDIEKGIHRIQEQKMTGSVVNCAVRVENTTWIGTKDGTIEAFGARHFKDVQCLWTKQAKTEVCALSAQPIQLGKTTLQYVYAAQTQGHLTIYSQKVTDELSRSSVNEQWEDGGQRWREVKTLCLGQLEDTCRCLLLVKGGLELWVSCGTTVVVVNPVLTLVEKRIEHTVLEKLGVVENMQYSASHGLVFCSSSKTSCVVVIDALSKKIKDVYSLDMAMVGMVIVQSNEEVLGGNENHDEEDAAWQQTATDRPQVDVGTQTRPRPATLLHSRSQRLGTQTEDKRQTFPRSKKSLINRSRLTRKSDREPRMPPHAAAAGGANVTAMLAVKDTLLVGRDIGDVVIVSINKEGCHGYQYGEVLTIFTPETILGYRAGSVHQILEAGKNRVVVSRDYQAIHTNAEEETQMFQITVWDQWGSDEFALFSRIHQKLDAAEEACKTGDESDNK
ncbi:leucine-rich repeat serine/threonine-protein kinase 1-like [Glandiceps talaboti]